MNRGKLENSFTQNLTHHTDESNFFLFRFLVHALRFWLSKFSSQFIWFDVKNNNKNNRWVELRRSRRTTHWAQFISATQQKQNFDI